MTWEKPDRKEYKLYDSVYIKSERYKIIDGDSLVKTLE